MRAKRRKAASACVVVTGLLLCALTAAAQSPQTQEQTLEAASAAFAQGFQLFQEGTAESLRAAVPKLETANELFRRAGDKKWQSATLLALGRIANDLDDKRAAIRRYEEAVPLLRELEEPLGVIAALNNIGTAYFSLGENQLALKYLEQSLPLTRQLGDKEEEARALSNIGSVYEILGDRQTALNYFEQALPLVRILEDKSQEATTLSNIGGLHYSSGNLPAALKYYEQALALTRTLKDKRLEATILNNIAVVYSDRGDAKKALELGSEVLLLRQATGDREGEAATLNNIGTQHLALGDGLKAVEVLNCALLLRRTTGDPLGEAVTLNNLMGSWRILNNPRFAAFHGKQAISIYQKLRSNIRGLGIDLQRTYLKSIEDTYRHLIRILITEGRLGEAQQMLNSLKDQQFFDFDQRHLRQSAPLTLTPREADLSADYERAIGRVGVADAQLEGLRRQISGGRPDARQAALLAQLEDNLKTASDDFVAVLRQAESAFSKPPDEKDKAGEVPDTREMQAALRELSRQTGRKAVAVYQFADTDSFRLILITPEDVRSVSTPIKDEVLQERALQFWALLQSDKYDPTKLGRELYQTIFAPLEKELPKDARTILWSLDGNLRYVPMAALHDGRQYLVERYSHVNFTRADPERMTRAARPNWTATGLGSSAAHTIKLPDAEIPFTALPGVGEELRLLIRGGGNRDAIFDGEIFQDAEFTRPAMLAALKQKRPLVHIASHFAFRPGDEARSFLLLGDGQPLTLAEMKEQEKLFDGVDLLTLSACNTAAQQTGANGREVDAFAELAQRLGASSVMATLWPVADNSTPRLMREFYQNRQHKNLSKAEALRLAQLALLNSRAGAKPLPAGRTGAPLIQVVVADDAARQTRNNTRAEIVYVSAKNATPYKKESGRPFSHPYFWSPFVLIGNPR
ncbi:MAG TPA: CHAT domain-containing protein [Pyrinomonadaceae bacterium]|nr:CHAT domain-containing protein [Pyrinomonadaceae bacterium]